MKKHTYSIKCTHCAAPLNIRGGGRVSTVTCEYCKSQLDMNKQYAVLSRFQNLHRPDTPFSLGMSGIIKGIEWIIIAHISYSSTDDIYDNWSEFFLYSPTHGYAWIIYEEGSILFSKRVRDFDLQTWKKNEKPKTIFYRGGHYLLKEEVYGADIQFVEGELTWISKKEDHILCWDYVGVSGKSLSIERTYSEVEVYLNEKLNTNTVYEDFSVPKEKRQKEESSIFKVDAGDIIRERSSILLYALQAVFVLLCFTMIYANYSPKQIHKFSTYDTNHTSTFSVNSSHFLTKISLRAADKKTLNEYTISLYKNNKKQLFISKNKLHIVNTPIKHSWNKSSKWSDIYIKLDTGEYKIVVKKPQVSTDILNVKIEDNIIRFYYLLPLFIVIIIFLLFLYVDKLDWKYSLLILGLIIVIWGYPLVGDIVLPLLGILFYFVFHSYTKYRGMYD